MAFWNAADREEFLSAIERAQPGDCIRIRALADAAKSTREMLSALERIRSRGLHLVSLQEGIDTRGEHGGPVFALVGALASLDRQALREKQQDGIAQARENGKYKGRKPIAVDEALFESVASLWRSGKITAREAMARLDLKPNTFYRRMKEQEEQKMKDYKKMEKDIREGIKEAAMQSRQDLQDLKKQVRAEAAEVKHAAGEAIDLHDVEKEIRKSRRQAEAEHQEAIRQLKKDVEAEAKELKKRMQED